MPTARLLVLRLGLSLGSNVVLRSLSQKDGRSELVAGCSLHEYTLHICHILCDRNLMRVPTAIKLAIHQLLRVSYRLVSSAMS